MVLKQQQKNRKKYIMQHWISFICINEDLLQYEMKLV